MRCIYCKRIVWFWQFRLHTVWLSHLTCGIAYDLGFNKGYEVAKANFSNNALSCYTLPKTIQLIGFSSPSGLGRTGSLTKM